MSKTKAQSLAVIGVGKIGEAIIRGLLVGGKWRPGQITGSVAHSHHLPRIKKLGIQAELDNRNLVRGKDIILLAVKPQNMDSVIREISSELTPGQVLITVAASVSSRFVEERLSQPMPVVRAMPNTPCLMNAGMTVLCGGSHAGKNHMTMAEDIFRSIGETVVLEESLMDGVTGLSASGPAYCYVIIESLAEAGVKLGIPRSVSTLLAAQTMFGAASMVLKSKEHPALLKDVVTTPAGCTIDGLLELEEGKLRVTLIKAVVKSAGRAKELVQTQES